MFLSCEVKMVSTRSQSGRRKEVVRQHQKDFESHYRGAISEFGRQNGGRVRLGLTVRLSKKERVFGGGGEFDFPALAREMRLCHPDDGVRRLFPGGRLLPDEQARTLAERNILRRLVRQMVERMLLPAQAHLEEALEGQVRVGPNGMKRLLDSLSGENLDSGDEANAMSDMGLESEESSEVDGLDSEDMELHDR